jgi:long-chain acyl-CoA synthetase
VQPVRQSLATLVDDFERHGNDTAIVSTRGVREHRTSYRQLAHLSRRFAAELVNRNINKGDRVILWGENSAEWVAAFFGCILRGVLPVPLDAAGSLAFAKRVMTDVSPRLLVGDDHKLQQISGERLPFSHFETELTWQTAQALSGLQPSDPLQIVFTSGTTGEPKGIVHTHGNVLASLEPIEREMQKYMKFERPFHPIRILHTLPLSHVFGQFMGLWTPPLLAAELHYENRLVAHELVARIHRQRISVLAAVPRVLDLMQAHALEHFPNLRARVEAASNMNAWQRWWHFRDAHRALGLKFWAFVCGGASLSPNGEQFWTRLGFVVVQGYGMTETTALVSLNHPFHAASGTIGRVLPGREVKLSDDGEVLVRGSTIANATWQRGQIEQQDSEWLATGDLAEFDAAGNLKFRGRKKDVIVTAAGLNIYPEDLEAALNRQPGVKASAVIEAQQDTGAEPLAMLLLAPDADAPSIVAAANAELAEFQQLRRWQVWPQADFPRTSTGKILKRELALQSHKVSSGEELNLDSLGRVELQAQVEQQFGVSLSDEALQTVRTRADVDALVRRGDVAPPQQPHRYPHWPWNPFMQAVRALFIEIVAMPILRFLAKPKLRRVPAEWPHGPVLIVCNHITSYDAPFVLFALPWHLRHRVAIAMSGEMMLDYRRGRNQGNWFLNLLAPIAYLLITGLFNVFPLPRSAGFRDSFRHAGEAIDRGYCVLVFPEGHRSEDGKPQPFRAGSGLLWKQLGTASLPVRIDGLGELKTSGRRWFRSGKISVTVGDLLAADTAASPEELTERLRAAVFGAEKPSQSITKT